MSNENTVWLCNYNDREALNIYGLHANIPDKIEATRFYELSRKRAHNSLTEAEQTEYTSGLEGLLKYIKQWFAGEYIENKNMPTQVYLEPGEGLPKVDEVAFQIMDGYLVVNKTCYEVMSQFNLGKTHFSEVEIINLETKTKTTEQPYYFINIAETRAFLDAENSKGVESSRLLPKDMPLRYILNPKNDDIKVKNTINTCDIDLWHDPNLVRSLFLSDKLVNALFDAGIKQTELALVRCRINN